MNMMQRLLSFTLFLAFYFQVTAGQGTFQFSCYNDTSYCYSGNSCRSCPRVRPYCDPTRQKCVADTPISDNCPSGIMNGAVPSLSSCTSYVECLGGVARRINCQAGSVFDPGSGTCQRGKPCYRFNCIPWEGSFVSYPGDPRLYAFCSGGRAVHLLSCPPGTQMVSGSNCQFVCPGVGSFIDYSNCQRYFQCIQIGRTLFSFSASCPLNQIFSPDVGRCINAAGNNNVLCSTNQTTRT